MERAYLVRFGLAQAVGRFVSKVESFKPGQSVVIRSHRGTELGVVLVEAPPSMVSREDLAPILRVASLDDLKRSRQAGLDRLARFEACRAIFQEGDWPFEVIDLEFLLDPERIVLHYLGPHSLQVSGLVAVLRSRLNQDVVFEPVGRDVLDPEMETDSPGCGNCGTSGGCGSGGCGSESGGCAVKALVTSRKRIPADA